MSSEMVNANPTKEFFVNMLVRDILLKQAIIALMVPKVKRNAGVYKD